MVLFSYYVNKMDFPFDKEISEEEKENTEIPKSTFEEILFNNNILPYVDILNKISITAIIIIFYYKIIKNLQANDLIQFSHFCFQLIDSNGLLVFIKILNQDFNSLNAQMLKIYNDQIVNIEFGYFIELILLYDLKLIHKICERNDELIVDYLIQCKVYVMLKKILNTFSDNDKINKICLKLFKCQIKFLDKNWRIENNNIITNIYLFLDYGKKDHSAPIENFLTLEKRDKNFKEPNPNYFTLEELRKIYQEYHNNNYFKYLNNLQEYENYQNAKYQSIYANIYLKMLKKVEKTFEVKEAGSN